MSGSARRLRPGRPEPLGATPDAGGVNFALFSRGADRVDLCLFDPVTGAETAQLPLPEFDGGVWHGYLPGTGPGLRYGYRVHGPFAPRRGQRFNPSKLLLDPYARAWTGGFSHDARTLLDPADPDADLLPDIRDSAPAVPKCVVVAESGPAEVPRPGTPWTETVIFEAHAKALTKRHPGVPPARRGTFLGLTSPAILDHLVGLGVTAVELLPLQAFVDEPFLTRKGLTNHWGYNPLGFFVPEPRYAAGTDPLAEARAAVAALHAAGIEVILDVVYNHTGEGDHLGPTLAFKGIDNEGYYRLEPDDPRRYVNHAGCGNTLDMTEPFVLRLCLDSLRYWVETVGVDGFRFDLGVTLARDPESFAPGAAFLDAIRQDPVLRRAKLIAEPWDLGPDGYRLGRFPAPFAEWNDRFRKGVRAFWRGDENAAPELAARLLGSGDLFEGGGRRPWASLNYVTSHDGFTLHDLVSFEKKRNGANLEGNRDGNDHNLSMNCGAEGPTHDPVVQGLRRRQRRNLLCTLLLAQGTPMLLMGDELGRTQGGNNNAYCQDNEASWVDWEGADTAFAAEVAALIALRRRHPVLRRARFMHGRVRSKDGRPNVTWLAPDGTPKRIAHWQDPLCRAFALLLDGDATEEWGDGGERLADDSFLLLFNANPHPARFAPPQGSWRVALDTAHPLDAPERPLADGPLDLAAHGFVLLRSPREG